MAFMTLLTFGRFTGRLAPAKRPMGWTGKLKELPSMMRERMIFDRFASLIGVVRNIRALKARKWMVSVGWLW